MEYDVARWMMVRPGAEGERDPHTDAESNTENVATVTSYDCAIFPTRTIAVFFDSFYAFGRNPWSICL